MKMISRLVVVEKLVVGFYIQPLKGSFWGTSSRNLKESKTFFPPKSVVVCKGVHYWANIHLWGEKKKKHYNLFPVCKIQRSNYCQQRWQDLPQKLNPNNKYNIHKASVLYKMACNNECTLIRLTTTHDYPVQHHRDFNAHLSIKDYFTAEKYNHSSSL